MTPSVLLTLGRQPSPLAQTLLLSSQAPEPISARAELLTQPLRGDDDEQKPCHLKSLTYIPAFSDPAFPQGCLRRQPADPLKMAENRETTPTAHP